MHHRPADGPRFPQHARVGRREGVHERQDGGRHAAAGDDVGDQDGEAGFGGEGVSEEEVVGEEMAEGVGVEDDCRFFGRSLGFGNVSFEAVEALSSS